MDDAAAPVHVVQPKQDLLRDLPDKRSWNALCLMPLDEAEQILPENLEDHADVGAIGTLVLEVVEEGDDV